MLISKIIYRLRLKLKDTNETAYSKYDILDALNETLRELRKTVTQYYRRLCFTVPDITTDLTETFDTQWPDDFNELIIEHALILLSPGDYAAKEQAKALWRQKVISLAGSKSNDVDIIHGLYNNYGHRRRPHFYGTPIIRDINGVECVFYYEGLGSNEYSLDFPCTNIQISNDDAANDLTIIIGLRSQTIKAGESLNFEFEPFTEITITASGRYRLWVLK